MKNRLATLSGLVVTSIAVAAAGQERQVALIDPGQEPVQGRMSDVGPDAVRPEPAPAAPAPKYTPLLGMRSPRPVTGARFDVTAAPFVKDGASGLAAVFLASGSYKLTESFGLGVKLGVDRVSMNGADTKVGFLNPQVSGTYGAQLGRWFRLGATLAVHLPLGSGGGDGGDQDLVAAHKAASLARSSMENSLFAVNDLATSYGLDFAFVRYGLTAQASATLITSFRVRGAEVQSDAYRVNSNYALGLGYLIFPALSVGAELRYQRYLSTPSSVEKDPSARHNLTAAGGVRVHVEVAKGVLLRPGASYGHGIVGPIEKGGYHIVQLDVPVAF